MLKIDHQTVLSNLDNLEYSQEAKDANPIAHAGLFRRSVHGLIIE